MRVLVFGASTAQGFWDTHGGWVQRLRSHYDSKQIEDFSASQPIIFNLGVSGDTSDDVLKRFEAETKARWPGDRELALVFSLGTNNAAIKNGSDRSSPSDYRNELIGLVEKARRFTDKILFVGPSPCDDTKTNPVAWDHNLHYQSDRIKLFDDVTRAFCLEQNIPHVPVYETFREKTGMGIELFQDGLRSNDLGHQLIYELVLPELDKLLV